MISGQSGEWEKFVNGRVGSEKVSLYGGTLRCGGGGGGVGDVCVC